MILKNWLIVVPICIYYIMMGQSIDLEYIVKLKGLKYEIRNHTIVPHFNTSVKMLNRTNQMFSIYMNVLEYKLEKIYIKVSTSYKHNTRYQPIGLGTIEEDVCAYLNGTKQGFVLPLIGPTVLASSNLNHRKCPITGEMYVKNCIPSYGEFPNHFLPSGQWRIEALLFTKEHNRRIEMVLGYVFIDIYPNRRFRKGRNHTFLEE